MKKERKPTHPGELFKLDYLEPRDISISSAARDIGVTRKAMSEFVNGKTSLSCMMARRLSDYTETSVEMWVNMQANLDSWKARNINMTEIKTITPIKQGE